MAIGVCLLCTGLSQALVAGNGAASTVAENDRAAGRLAPDSGRKLEVFPTGDPFAYYLADPHAPGAGILLQSFVSTGIKDSGSPRFHLKFGGRFGLLRWLPREADGRVWQLSLDLGLDAQFDFDNSQDNTGWDGNYGAMLTTARPESGLGYKFGILHTSAHIGDELIERTGRRRINYTREELLAAVSRHWTRQWRTYLEAGWAYSMRNEELMDPGRLQVGAEYRAPGRLAGGLLGWYAAADFSVWEERDWRLDSAAQIGLMLTPADRTWRFGVQFWDGRPPLGEFFQDTETEVTLGLWAEL